MGLYAISKKVYRRVCFCAFDVFVIVVMLLKILVILAELFITRRLRQKSTAICCKHRRGLCDQTNFFFPQNVHGLSHGDKILQAWYILCNTVLSPALCTNPLLVHVLYFTVKIFNFLGRAQGSISQNCTRTQKEQRFIVASGGFGMVC